MKRKLILFFTSVFLLFYSSVVPTLATTSPTVAPEKWYSPSLGSFINKVNFSPDQEIFGERYTYAQVVWIIHSFSTLMQSDIYSKEVRDSIDRIMYNYSNNQPVAIADYSRLGVSGLILGSMSELYRHPPASGIQYIAQGLQKFNLVSPAYAQGYGYSQNQLVRPLWTASRNVCYFLMVVLLIAAGFMIMFRVKVNAQTAVSIQVMIPKIIITLILITFSYAIAGLLIDLTYLVLTLCLSMLSSASVVSNLGNAVKFFTGGFSKIATYYLGTWIVLLAAGVIFAGVTGGLGIILPLIITIVIAWLLIKVWWMLLQTYISIMIGFILAPWQILLDLLPGGKGFSSWLRNMVANCAVFVVVPLMFLLAMYISTNFSDLISQVGGTGSLSDPLVEFINDFASSNPTGVAVHSANISAISLPFAGFGSTIGVVAGFFAALAILALIPKTAEMVKTALKASSFKYGSAFGEPLAGAASFIGSDSITGPNNVWRRPVEALGGNASSLNTGLLKGQDALNTVSGWLGQKK